MPQKNSIKTYVEGGYYHVYNRGVEKRTIFMDSQDYKVFLKYLREYVSPPNDVKKRTITITVKGASFKGVPKPPKNYHGKIDLIAYCLMPNHFHLLVRQNSQTVIEGFMRSLATRYSMYFNKKYKRVGKLFQGHYKAVLVQSEAQLLHLSRYIHLNPQEYTDDLLGGYSSYAHYIGSQKTSWVNAELVLAHFHNVHLPPESTFAMYKTFVESNVHKPQEVDELLAQLTLDDTLEGSLPSRCEKEEQYDMNRLWDYLDERESLTA